MVAKKENASKHVDVESLVGRDELVDLLANELNKSNKSGGKIAYYLDEKEDPSTITDWVSTGSTMLDLAISNRPYGGLPVGRFSLLEGLEGSSKSLLCAHIVANTQKKGGVAVYIDTESSAAPEFWSALGVDLKKMLYIPLNTLEDIFEKIEQMIAVVRKSNNDRLCTIIVDSIAAASTKSEMESDYERKGFATGKSLILSEAMRKLTNLIAKRRILVVFTNQLRMNLKAMAFADPWVSPGGKAAAFHASVRVRLSVVEKIKNTDKEIIGTSVKALVTKNRMGPPYKKAGFDIYFDSGIADYASWIELAKVKKILDGPSNKLNYNNENFTTDEFIKALNTNSAFKNEFYKKICDSVIMQYKTPNSIILDDVIREEQNENSEVGETE